MYKYLLLINLFGIGLFGQNIDNNINYDSLIRVNHPEVMLDNDYYVFLYPLLGATTTFAPQFIKEYRNLIDKKVKKCNENILIIFFNEGGIAENKIKEYLKTALKLTEEEISNINYIVNNELYKKLNQSGELVKLLFLKNRELVYFKVCKFHNITDYNISHKIYDVKFIDKVKINSNNNLILEVDNLYKFQKDKLLLLTDIEDKILSIDINNGETTNFINHKNLNALDIYCNIISKNDSIKCNYAKFFHSKLKDSNRQTLNFLNINHDNSNVFIYTSIEVFEKETSSYKFKNDENKKVTVNTGQPILTGYSVFLKYHNDSLVNIYNVKDAFIYKKNKEVYNMFDLGFLKLDNELYTFQTSYPFFKNTKKQINKFVLNNDNIEKSKAMYPGLPRKTNKRMSFNNLKNFFFRINGNNYFMNDISKYIYEIGTKKPVGSLSGNGEKEYKKEVYKMFSEQNKIEKRNIEIHDVEVVKISAKKLLVVYYEFKGKPLIEILDKNLNSLEIINVSFINNFNLYYENENRSNLLINNDKIYFISLQGNDYFLYEYQIQKTCDINSN